jgi:hypothetical protein
MHPLERPCRHGVGTAASQRYGPGPGNTKPGAGPGSVVDQARKRSGLAASSAQAKAGKAEPEQRERARFGH